MQLSAVYLRREHRDVLVVRDPGGDGGRAHVETVVCVWRILHPPEKRELKLDADVSGGPEGTCVMVQYFIDFPDNYDLKLT